MIYVFEYLVFLCVIFEYNFVIVENYLFRKLILWNLGRRWE